jgi:hypothetical protein
VIVLDFQDGVRKSDIYMIFLSSVIARAASLGIVTGLNCLTGLTNSNKAAWKDESL